MRFNDFIQGKAPLGSKRSSQWKRVRSEHLLLHGFCMACGGKEKLEVHHIIPFHIAPDLELVPSNLMTLCESKKKGINCHLFVGHRGDYKSYRENAFAWANLIAYGLDSNKEIKEEEIENIV